MNEGNSPESPRDRGMSRRGFLKAAVGAGIAAAGVGGAVELHRVGEQDQRPLDRESYFPFLQRVEAALTEGKEHTETFSEGDIPQLLSDLVEYKLRRKYEEEVGLPNLVVTSHPSGHFEGEEYAFTNQVEMGLAETEALKRMAGTVKLNRLIGDAASAKYGLSARYSTHTVNNSDIAFIYAYDASEITEELDSGAKGLFAIGKQLPGKLPKGWVSEATDDDPKDDIYSWSRAPHEQLQEVLAENPELNAQNPIVNMRFENNSLHVTFTSTDILKKQT